MGIRVSHPNGSTVEFPDGTDPSVITQAMRQLDGPKAAPKPQLSPIEQRANERVRKEAEGGFKPQASPSRYLPFGSFLDEASAGIDAGLNMVTGGRVGQPYDEAKAYQNARQRYVDENASGLEQGAAIAGGIAASLPMAAGANIFRGTTLLPQMGNAAATGAGYGALYGAGEGEGGERVKNAVGGAAIGASAGAILVPIARGASNALSYAGERMARAPGPLANMERRAVNSTLDDMNSSNLDAGRYAQQRQQLGPEGMLMDMGEDLALTGEALANTNGPQMRMVRQALIERRQGAPARIAQTLDNNIGPAVNVVDAEQQLRTFYGSRAAPLYDQFHQTSIPTNTQIAQVLDDIPQGAFAQAEKLARAEGYRQQFRLRPVNGPMTPMTGVQGRAAEQVPTGLEYDYLKRAVDDMARSAQRGTNEQRIYSDLARRLRTAVDETLSPQDPTQSTWAQARRIAGDGLSGREALEEGGQAFSRGLTPDQLAADQAQRSALDQQIFNVGARDQLRTTMGNSSTNFGQNGDAAVRRQLNSQFAQDKLAQIIPPRNAAAINRRVRAENTFADTDNQVRMNSATARRTAAQRRLPLSSEQPLGDNQPRTISEASFVAARKVLNAVMAGGLNERAGRIMADQARLLTARGVDRDQYVQALLQLGARRGMTQQHRQTILQMINALGSGARTPLIESATSSRANP